MKEISKKQREVYDYLVKRMQSGPPPSVREIGSAVGLSSTSSVQAILEVLEKAEYIKRDPMLKRSIRVSNRAENVIQVPLYGEVAAGQFRLTTDETGIEEYIPYSGRVSSDKSLFALRVKGDSMRDAGILDGDIIFAEETSVASNREKIVAVLGNEATVKTYFRENGHIRLQPENDSFKPIICEEEEVRVLGKVIGLLRYYH